MGQWRTLVNKVTNFFYLHKMLGRSRPAEHPRLVRRRGSHSVWTIGSQMAVLAPYTPKKIRDSFLLEAERHSAAGRMGRLKVTMTSQGAEPATFSPDQLRWAVAPHKHKWVFSESLFLDFVHRLEF
jgi:hypothetical protein